MSITSSIGLISGIDIKSLIDQLMAIEARPRQLIEQRNVVLQSQQTALQGVSAKLLALKSSAGVLTKSATFDATTATSSNEAALTVSSSSSAVPGSYPFTVSRLATAQQIITGGFVDINSTPVSSGSLTFEKASARLDSKTRLRDLNGGVGVRRGKIKITDRSGASATIDLSAAVTIRDVIGRINQAGGINVTASVGADGLVITDNTGSVTSNLIIENTNLGATATNLGLVANVAANAVSGTNINTVGTATLVTAINDGNGVHIKNGVNDLSITLKDLSTFNVNFENVATLGDAINVINQAAADASITDLTAAINDAKTGIKLTDTSVGGGSLTVAALNSSNAAADLGVLGSNVGGVIQGTRLNAALDSKLISNLNGGAGVTTLGTIDVTNRLGVLTNIDLTGSSSVSDLISKINNASAGVTASLNNAGNGILLTDTSGGGNDIIIADNTGTTATDLNLAGTFSGVTTVDAGNLQLQYITQGTNIDGLGVARGKFTITDSNGGTATVDLTQGNEKTIADVISEINSRGLAINARINDNGDGILIEDNGSGGVAIKIEEAGATTALTLGLLGEAKTAGADLDGSFEKIINIASITQVQGATALSSLNGGDGVDILTGQDDFEITVRNGTQYNVDLTGATTVTDVINTINTATGGNVTVTITGLGTRLTLTDATTGSSTFGVKALNSSTAATDLGVLTSDDNGDGVVNGSVIVETTTLQDLVKKITDAKVGVTAAIVNDGSIGKPFRLSLFADKAGEDSAFIFDDGGAGLGATTLSEAQNTLVFYGSSDPANALAISSSKTTLENVIPGATIDLHATSNTPVEVTVASDTSSVVSSVSDLVAKFNGVVSTIDSHDSFDSETKKRGLLLGDAAVGSVRSSLFSRFIGLNGDLTSQFKALSQVGVTVQSGGTGLQFNETKFRDALQANPQAVENLFTFKETDADGEITARGVGVAIEQLLNRLTDADSGQIDNRVDTINKQVELNKKRIEDINELLELKRGRLESQFIAMEIALAQLQTQSQALASFQPITPRTSSNSGSLFNN